MTEMIESILFKNVQILTASGQKQGDVYVLNGKIVAVQPVLNVAAECVIQDKGLTLMPGVFDPHVHFREPGFPEKETIYSGSKAAVRGGVTSFFEMPNTNPPTIDAKTVAQKKAIAAETSLANYNFFIGATTTNCEALNQVENVPGIKIFVGSSTGNMCVDDQTLLELIFSSGNRLIAVHSEDEATIQKNRLQFKDTQNVDDHYRIRDVNAAMIATKRVVALANRFKRRLHICHLTTGEEAEYLAQCESPYVTTEVTPQHLLLWAPECYAKLGTFAQINPPIRQKRHADALWHHLKRGTIHCVGTDHAPHTIAEKMKPFGDAPSGMPGVETSLPLFLTLAAQGKCTYSAVVKWLSAAPAQIYQVPQKGDISEGFDADLTLVDLNKRHTLSNAAMQTNAGWSAFEGWDCQGEVVATFVNGQPVYREGDFFESIKGKEIKIGV
jgi:dihydroorotase